MYFFSLHAYVAMFERAIASYRFYTVTEQKMLPPVGSTCESKTSIYNIHAINNFKNKTSRRKKYFRFDDI